MARFRTRLYAAFALSGFIATSTFAQVLDNKTVERIVGSDIKADTTTAVADEARVIAAIDRSSENIALVRKTARVGQVDIVFMTDAVETEGGPPRKIAQALKERHTEIAKLRQEIEANALLYHAINSRKVLISQVLAVEFKRLGEVVIYAAAKPPA